MPDWLAPYHVPVLTDAEFAQRKAEYVAKNGFSMTIPGLSDIIKIKTQEPMNFQEHQWWKKKQWHKFSEQRYEELKKEKQKKKDRYLAMLSSPTPAIVQNAGSILTAIDDAQDATITLATLGQLARKVAPKTAGKILKGPVGLLTLGSDALNVVQNTAMYCMAPMYGKKGTEQMAKASPRNLKAKLKSRMNLKARLPNKSDWIQALQTSDQVFGFGISLGPLVGLVQDIWFGSVRSRPGEYMDIKLPVPDVKHWCKAAMKVAKASSLLFSWLWETDDEEILTWIMGAAHAFQYLNECNQVWNPLEMTGNLDTIEIQAPLPWHTLTQEVISAEPLPLDSVIGWPQTGNQWSTVPEIMEGTEETATLNINNFLTRNKHSWAGFVGGLATCEGAAYALSTMEGEDDVYYDYTIQMKVSIMMQKEGYFLDPAQPYSKFQLFQYYLDECEKDDWMPSMKQIIQWCTYDFNNIRLLRTIPVTA